MEASFLTFISNQDKKVLMQKFATFYIDMQYNIFGEDYYISSNLMGKFYLWSNYLYLTQNKKKEDS